MNLPSGFPNHMMKEIHEQPRAVRDTALAFLAPGHDRVLFDSAGLDAERARQVARMHIVGSGSSRHAGLIGRCMLEELAGIPVQVEHASEYQHRDPITGAGVLTVLVSQSGETTDTLAAQRLATACGSETLAIANVPGSTLLRSADMALAVLAGEEVSIASTKAFSAQVTALYLLGLYLGEARGRLARKQLADRIADLLAMQEKMEHALRLSDACRSLAAELRDAPLFLLAARGIHYPAARDGALKLQETSYIPAQAYPGGELPHGPLALVEERVPVLFLAAHDPADAGSTLRQEMTLAALRRTCPLSPRVLAVCVEDDEECAAAAAGRVLAIPPAPELLLPLLEIVPLQLLACHLATLLGRDVDRPRHLSKSVREE